MFKLTNGLLVNKQIKRFMNSLSGLKNGFLSEIELNW